ncbi:alpha/beta fold hydrolase [Piscibacillus salipiscarius]|uniref:Alpha/beta fold hydrolase n=1 Tax=Piscibacillus salipiscarius TaxID=299480 RepID=A0ABW5QDH5_9BACI|nr:alpha/beta hydrolase [Piscibacillus salipiscarius]
MDLHYETRGKGPVIVLLHSGGVDMREWSYLVPLLVKHFKVITFDARGVGNSPSPTTSQVDYVDDLLKLLDYLEEPQVSLVGHSIGGQIATEFALMYPERVENLILIAPSLSGFEYSHEFKKYLDNINQAAPDINKMVDLSLKGSLYKVVMAGEHRDFMVEMHRKYFERVLQWPAFEMIWPAPPANKRLTNLTVKTLLLIGGVDFKDNHRVLNCFDVASDVCNYEIINADHMVTLTHPSELYEQITNFIKE